MRRWLVLIFAGCVALAGSRLAIAEPAAASADAIFQARCAACHSVARAVRPLKAMGESLRRRHLETFLADHHVSDPSERALLVDYLLKAAAK